METIKIHIDQTHIDNSDPSVSSSCMIAKALREQLDLTPDAQVDVFDGTEMSVEGIPVKAAEGQRRRVSAKINSFDRAQKVKPFEFDLEVPQGFREAVNKRVKARRS